MKVSILVCAFAFTCLQVNVLCERNPSKLLVSGSVQNKSANKYENFEEVIYILGLIQHTPIWMHVDKKDPITNKIILEYLKEISKYDIKSIRSAVEMYTELDINGKDYLYRMSRLFILNRYLFNVPPNAAPIFPVGGWSTDPVTQPKIDALWPLSMRSNGEILITGKARHYTGPVFEALKEFDLFSKIYGLRKR